MRFFPQSAEEKLPSPTSGQEGRGGQSPQHYPQSRPKAPQPLCFRMNASLLCWLKTSTHGFSTLPRWRVPVWLLVLQRAGAHVPPGPGCGWTVPLSLGTLPTRWWDCRIPFSGVASWDEDSDPDSAAAFSLVASELTSFNLGGLCREMEAQGEESMFGWPWWAGRSGTGCPSAGMAALGTASQADGFFLQMAFPSRLWGPTQAQQTRPDNSSPGAGFQPGAMSPHNDPRASFGGKTQQKSALTIQAARPSQTQPSML